MFAKWCRRVLTEPFVDLRRHFLDRQITHIQLKMLCSPFRYLALLRAFFQVEVHAREATTGLDCQVADLSGSCDLLLVLVVSQLINRHEHFLASASAVILALIQACEEFISRRDIGPRVEIFSGFEEEPTAVDHGVKGVSMGVVGLWVVDVEPRMVREGRGHSEAVGGLRFL